MEHAWFTRLLQHKYNNASQSLDFRWQIAMQHLVNYALLLVHNIGPGKGMCCPKLHSVHYGTWRPRVLSVLTYMCAMCPCHVMPTLYMRTLDPHTVDKSYSMSRCMPQGRKGCVLTSATEPFARPLMRHGEGYAYPELNGT